MIGGLRVIGIEGTVGLTARDKKCTGPVCLSVGGAN